MTDDDDSPAVDGPQQAEGSSSSSSHDVMDDSGRMEENDAVKATKRSNSTAEAEADKDQPKNAADGATEHANERQKIEPMELEQTRSEDIDEDEERNDDDLEALLGSSESKIVSNTSTTASNKKKKGSCCKVKRYGNVKVLCQGCHKRTGYGIIGPHWFGPFVVCFIVAWASTHFVHKAHTSVGPISTAVCAIFAVLTIYYLFATSFKDPGIVKAKPTTSINIEDDDELADHRWCDFCNVYQPPDGAHCPDCNVCIAGYDHHCVWMGVCIGKGNMKSFVRFNMCWILYLLYATLWVSLVGPLVFKHAHKHGGKV